MQIGFLIDTFAIGGSELNAIKVAESLHERGVALTVFHFQTDGPIRARYEKLGVELIHVPLRGLFSISALNATRFIRRNAGARKLDLLHTHCVYSNIVGAGVRRLSLHALPLLASRRWTGYADRPGLHKLNAYAQSAADAVLVNAPSLERVVKQESPTSSPVYIPNLLPEANFQLVSSEARKAARIAVGLPAETLVVGCVARLAPVKDHRTLLDAWRIVAAELPDAVLAIIGGGGLRDDLEAYVEQLHVRQSVRFTGELPPQSLPHSLLDVSVLASQDEGFPNSLLEAMAQRVPVVSTNVGGVADLVTNGKNGLLVPPRGPRALADAILRVLRDDNLRAELIERAHASAEAHRSIAVTDALLRTYRAIAAG